MHAIQICNSKIIHCICKLEVTVYIIMMVLL